MHVVISFVLGAVVGSGLTYAYRGLIAREKAKASAEAAALKSSAEKAVQDTVNKV